MANLVIMDMLANEQNRRNQEEIRQIQLLNAAGNQPLGFFHVLCSWISGFSVRHIELTTTDNDSTSLSQPHHS
jgi:hypothetical protein